MARTSLYDRMLLSPLTDIVCGLPPIARLRERIVPQAEGVVLEPGMGSGLNLAHYDPERVKQVIGVDPNEKLLALARKRARDADVPVEILAQSAEALPLENESVDTVVLTYTGCSIPDIRSALAEFFRVLKPGGRLLLCEHGRAEEPRVQRLQDWLTPAWRQLAGGCHLNRDLPALLKDAGFAEESIERFYALPRPKVLAWHYLGSVRKH